MSNPVTAEVVKGWLSDGGEIAFLDVREHGQYGEGHPFFVIPLPYSVFEARLPHLVPNQNVRMVLLDDGDRVAEHAATRAEALGYTNIHTLTGGAPAWREAGFTLFAGVNVPSKTFGELLELARHTPRLSADQVIEIQRGDSDHIIIDGRPFAEYNKFSIPGGICCPNGELALRIRELVPDPKTTIIVNCAGRTRSILGAQTLIDAGVENPVYALENGTQGWFLAGLDVDRGATRKYDDVRPQEGLDHRRQTVQELAVSAGAQFVDVEQARNLLADETRTTYLLDVRTSEEFAANAVPGSVHAPGGQLVQATDQWVGVRGARILLLDDDGIRAPMVANWLSQLGHEAIVVTGGVTAVVETFASSRQNSSTSEKPSLKVVEPGAASLDGAQLVDLRPSMTFREGHIEGACWSVRPRLHRLGLDPVKPIVLIADEETAALAAHDLRDAGCNDVAILAGTLDDWKKAGHTIVANGQTPPDADCIDFLFFTSERHNGNEAASRQYLEWEIGLVDQLDDQERSTFRIVQP